MGGNFKDITGQKFGMLTVRKRFGIDKYGNALWLCDCDCGYKGHIVSTHHLRSGSTRSCTCLRSKRMTELNKKKSFYERSQTKYPIRL